MVYDVDSIKQHNPIADVAAARGVHLRESGTHLVGRCPFHEDEHPSFAVYPETRSFYCFGCNTGGDVIDFVRRADNLSFRDALELLSNGQQSTASGNSPRPEMFSLDDRMILTAAAGVYHEALLRAPHALKYLQGRGITMPVVQRCRLGFSDGRSLRPYFQRHRLSIKRATEMGLFWPTGARGETMAGRIVVPELRGGQCIWMLGRALSEERQPKYRGLSLPKPILGYERVRGRPRVFVTEGAFDYLTGVTWGLPMCALLGTQVRAERLGFLQRIRRVLIVFDNDAPGSEAAASLAQSLGSRARVVALPEGVKDLSELAARPHGRATFFQVLRDAERQEDAGEA
jgi:DNA primase